MHWRSFISVDGRSRGAEVLLQAPVSIVVEEQALTAAVEALVLTVVGEPASIRVVGLGVVEEQVAP